MYYVFKFFMYVRSYSFQTVPNHFLLLTIGVDLILINLTHNYILRSVIVFLSFIHFMAYRRGRVRRRYFRSKRKSVSWTKETI